MVFSFSSAQIEQFCKKSFIAALFCKENSPAPAFLLMLKKGLVSNTYLSALMHFALYNKVFNKTNETQAYIFFLGKKTMIF